jgi:hypothetical protein
MSFRPAGLYWNGNEKGTDRLPEEKDAMQGGLTQTDRALLNGNHPKGIDIRECYTIDG